jgi:hypothetical protein
MRAGGFILPSVSSGDAMSQGTSPFAECSLLRTERLDVLILALDKRRAISTLFVRRDR